MAFFLAGIGAAGGVAMAVCDSSMGFVLSKSKVKSRPGMGAGRGRVVWRRQGCQNRGVARHGKGRIGSPGLLILPVLAKAERRTGKPGLPQISQQIARMPAQQIKRFRPLRRQRDMHKIALMTDRDCQPPQFFGRQGNLRRPVITSPRQCDDGRRNICRHRNRRRCGLRLRLR